MNIDLNLIRNISVLSILFGIILGFVTLIPYVGIFSLIFLICFIAPLVIWLLIKYNCLSLTSIKESIVIGAIAGFISYLGFSAVYIPITIVLMEIFKISSNYGVALTLLNGNFFILTVLSIFMAVLSATVNSFTGFLTFYIIEIFNSMEKK